MDNEIAVKVSHVGKTFHESQGAGSFKEAFVNIGRKLTGKKEKKIHRGEYTALKDIDFEIKKGEFFGIVGRNGCGKSTLLKIIAGVYMPTKGAVSVNGSLTPFIELGVGFNPELSGKDNVYLNGALLGFTRKQMDEMYNDIVDFAELKEFMDMKLKNYSSGMQVRLAFSVAIRADSDILLIDEVLAVGDTAFQEKCYEYFENLKLNNKTVILVTHDMNSMKRYCSRALLIEDGNISFTGSVKKTAVHYENLFNTNKEVVTVNNKLEDKPANRWGSGEAVFEEVKLINEKDAKEIRFSLNVKSNNNINKNIICAFTVKSGDGKNLFGDSVDLGIIQKGTNSFFMSFDNILARGKYHLDLSLRIDGEKEYLDFWIDAFTFRCGGPKNDLSILARVKLRR